MADSAYLAALRLLARRELSEAQVRQRLARRGHASDDVETAVTRLKTDHSLDDARAAMAIARTQTALRGRGRRRVARQIQAAGIDASLASRTTDAVFSDIDPDALLEAALLKRLRGRERIDDERDVQRLYRYLVGQGFESDRVLAILRARRSNAAPTRG